MMAVTKIEDSMPLLFGMGLVGSLYQAQSSPSITSWHIAALFLALITARRAISGCRWLAVKIDNWLSFPTF